MARRRIVFKHDSKYLYQALGITEEEANDIDSTVREALSKLLSPDSDFPISKAISMLYEKYRDNDPALVLSIYMLGRKLGHLKCLDDIIGGIGAALLSSILQSRPRDRDDWMVM